MRKLAVRITAVSQWAKWTAELEAAFGQLVRDLAKDFGHRARFYSGEGKQPYWKVTAFITARSLTEGEEMRRAAVTLAKKRALNLIVHF